MDALFGGTASHGTKGRSNGGTRVTQNSIVGTRAARTTRIARRVGALDDALSGRSARYCPLNALARERRPRLLVCTDLQVTARPVTRNLERTCAEGAACFTDRPIAVVRLLIGGAE